jgi:hypothetical protein
LTSKSRFEPIRRFRELALREAIALNGVDVLNN